MIIDGKISPATNPRSWDHASGNNLSSWRDGKAGSGKRRGRISSRILGILCVIRKKLTFTTDIFQ
jgi:hypothetical protein